MTNTSMTARLGPSSPQPLTGCELKGLQPIGSLFLPDDNDTGPDRPTDPGTGGGTVDQQQ